jgi:transcriptional regulator with XRE-family HTH domain
MIAMPKQRTATATEIFAANVTRLRAERGWSQVELAAQASIARVNLNRIERGHAQPTWETACAIADALGVSTEELRANIF